MRPIYVRPRVNWDRVQHDIIAMAGLVGLVVGTARLAEMILRAWLVGGI